MKKVLILSMTCGEGHNAVANSILKQLELQGANATIAQIYGYKQGEIEFQNKLFLFASRYIPRIYNYVWNMNARRNPNKRYIGGIQPSIRKATPYVHNIINTFKPDIVFCTHFYAGAIVNNLKRDGLLNPSIQTYAILTDYCVHPFWETNYLLDAVFTPVTYTHPTFIQKGFSNEQLVCTGFPVDAKFDKVVSREQARTNLGLNNNSFVAMIVSGGYCIANPIPIVKQLMHDTTIEMIVVCGKNKKRFNQMQKLINKHNLTRVKLFGYATNIPEMMAAADCLISRGGANFITEALHSNLPIIFREKTIINEKLNAKMLTEHGCSLFITHPKQIISQITYIKNPINKNAMIQNIKNIQQPNALNNVCNYLLKGEQQ